MRKNLKLSSLLGLCLYGLLACQPAQERIAEEPAATSGPTVDSVDLAAYFPDTLLNRLQQEVDDFQQQDRQTPPQQGSALFVGSSSLRMWDSLQTDMAPVPVINRGFGGSTLPEVLYYFNELVMPYQPKVILLYAGENDLAMTEAGISPESVRETFEIFVNTVKARLPATEKIYFISVKPSVSRWELWPQMQQANQLIQAYAGAEDRVEFLDIRSGMMAGDEVRKDIFLQDNLHMNRKGYAIWTSTIKPLLMKDFDLQ